MWLALAKKPLSLEEKTLDQLFWDLDANDKWGDYDLKIELLSRIKDERTFTQVITRLQQSILDSIIQKKLIDTILLAWYKDKYTNEGLKTLEESFNHHKESYSSEFDDIINRNVKDIMNMAWAVSGEPLELPKSRIDEFIETRIKKDN